MSIYLNEMFSVFPFIVLKLDHNLILYEVQLNN